MSSVPQKPVTKRQVFYIPGYDPFHPRRYRELYRKESAEQAQVSGYDIALSPEKEGDRFGWHLDARMSNVQVSTDFRVLVWSDIVKNSMHQGIAGTYVKMCKTAYIYIASGVLFQLMRLRKGPIIAALYPVVFLVLQLLLAIGAGSFLVWGGKLALMPLFGTIGHMIALGFGVWAVYLVLRWFKRLDSKLFAYYLMHDYSYSAGLEGAYTPELEERLAEFRTTISAALEGGVDEVLVVGHSSGAHLGVSIVADLLRHESLLPDGPKLSLLTLGQVIPMVSFLRNADRLRSDLNCLAASDLITWVDVSAPGDGGSFALCDPVAVSGVAPDEPRWPLVISCAFSKTLSPKRWKSLRWRFLRLHYQYLCAFDRPGDYDYFTVTAGPMSLSERYANRAPSPSRICEPTSRFTSTRP